MSLKASAAQLGVVPGELQTEARADGSFSESSAAPDIRYGALPRADYFVRRNGLTFAGTHLLVDLWAAHRLSDQAHIEAALRRAVEVCGATLLYLHLHHFGPESGVSGVVVLAESHISIHTWPERNYAAIDLFMCGACDPYLAVPVLKEAFTPESVQVTEQKRGVVP